MRLLALISDAYGGRGGIAKFNRDMLAAVVAHEDIDEVVVLPRVIVEDVAGIPQRIVFREVAAGSKARFALSALNETARGDFDGVICGHINLLPFAYAAARRAGVPLLLVVHGIDAWTPTGRRLTDALVSKIDRYVVVSDFTRRRFAQWSRLNVEDGIVIPNCIDASRYGTGPRRPDLLDRYGLHDRRILFTLGRMSSQERYKGFDEVIDVLPDLVERLPDIAYLIAGDGDDRPRLEAKVRARGLTDRVVFAGYVADDEKVDHFRLADAFVMPGRGEGFGIVYLEALACGIPVVASCLDASQEAVLGGDLGEVVDPRDPADLRRGILAALATDKSVPERLAEFSYDRFNERWKSAVADVFIRNHAAVGVA